ncbi:hypothetical protein TRIUR3_23399 [Triticum urartu]|uniref:Uncharacterized protein n=1 Tax=Triticum urartu TaxID=4572 RepID=M7ZUW3_TRIUA|nr:hypothetical protein TRIUR3_23399 [Triticum urartu]
MGSSGSGERGDLRRWGNEESFCDLTFILILFFLQVHRGTLFLCHFFFRRLQGEAHLQETIHLTCLLQPLRILAPNDSAASSGAAIPLPCLSLHPPPVGFSADLVVTKCEAKLLWIKVGWMRLVMPYTLQNHMITYLGVSKRQAVAEASETMTLIPGAKRVQEIGNATRQCRSAMISAHFHHLRWQSRPLLVGFAPHGQCCVTVCILIEVVK